MTMRILVTGADGMLGRFVAPTLMAAGHRVLQCTRGEGSEIRADLIDPAQAFAALSAARPDAIVNLAAMTDVDLCEREPHLAYLSNVRIVENLARWITSERPACHLIQLSTDQIYDGAGPQIEENITLSNYYGFSKYAGELAAKAVPSTVLRTNFFGMSRTPSRRSLSDWVVQSLTASAPITVYDDIRFSPLALQSLAYLIGVVVSNPHFGVYNLGSRDGMSKADFAFMFADLLHLQTESMCRGRSQPRQEMAYRPLDMRMDSSRFERAFGLVLPSLREEILSTCVSYEIGRG